MLNTPIKKPLSQISLVKISLLVIIIILCTSVWMLTLVTLSRKAQGLLVSIVLWNWHKYIEPPTCSVNIRLYLLPNKMMTDDVLVMNGKATTSVHLHLYHLQHHHCPSHLHQGHSLASQTEDCLQACFCIQYRYKVQWKPDHLFDNSIDLTHTCSSYIHIWWTGLWECQVQGGWPSREQKAGHLQVSIHLLLGLALPSYIRWLSSIQQPGSLLLQHAVSDSLDLMVVCCHSDMWPWKCSTWLGQLTLLFVHTSYTQTPPAQQRQSLASPTPFQGLGKLE